MLPPDVFELDKIRLRRPTVADAKAIFMYGSDPEVAYYAYWPIRTSINPVIESLQERETHRGSGNEVSWVITLVSDDRATGGVKCSVGTVSAEIGFLLNRQFWGRGIAAKATGAVFKWLFSLPRISKVHATCDTENNKSIRVLEKLQSI